MISFSREEYKFPSVPVSRDSNYDELKALIVISRDIRVFWGIVHGFFQSYVKKRYSHSNGSKTISNIVKPVLSGHSK